MLCLVSATNPIVQAFEKPKFAAPQTSTHCPKSDGEEEDNQGNAADSKTWHCRRRIERVRLMRVPLPQVIGAGFGRTGTNSLKVALEMVSRARMQLLFE